MSNQPRLGIQLYSVRDLTGNETFKDTLRALADLGFQGVEFAWKYGGMAPDELAEFLQSAGTRWLIYEQDRYPVSPLASAAVCAGQCRAAGLIG